jgi:hypothetical protein
VTDGHGDTVGGSSAAGDIATTSAGGTSSTRTFALKTVQPSDPKTDPAWRGTTGIVWSLDTDFDGLVDTTVVLSWDTSTSRLAAAIFDGNNRTVCNGAASYTDLRLVASFGICGLRVFQWQAVFIYDNTPTNLYDDTQADLAPDVGLAPPTPPHRDGYWLLGGDGRTYGFCGAPSFVTAVGGAGGFAARPDGAGEAIVAHSGVVVPAGRMAGHGSAALAGGEVAVAIVSTTSGKGYWVFTSRGRVFHFGDAGYFGDLRAKQLNKPVIAAAATPSGRGYYMVGFDGGVFTFGDAVFRGSMGGKHLNAPVVGVAASPDGQGYWLVGIDGGVFSFNAPFRGSMAGKHLNQAVIGIAAHGDGYLLGAADGGVFNFAHSTFCGSLAGQRLPAAIIAIAAFSS